MTSALGHLASSRQHGASRLDDVVLPSHLVAYQAPAAAPPVTPTTVAPVTPTTEAEPQPAVVPQAIETPTTTAVETRPVGNSEVGQATWYSEAPAGMCASPTLPFGTVVTVRNNANGATTSCTIDDREQDGYPRVLDMSYSGFSQIADPSQGVVDVTISW